MRVGGYFIPRWIPAVLVLLLAALLIGVMWSTLSGSSGHMASPAAATTSTRAATTTAKEVVGQKKAKKAETGKKGAGKGSTTPTKDHAAAPPVDAATVSGSVAGQICQKRNGKNHCELVTIARVRVSIKGTTAKAKRIALVVVTDDSGHLFVRLPAGRYVLRALGHRSGVLQVRLAPSETKALPPIRIRRS